MKIIKILSEQIGEELCDAEHYIEMALQYKPTHFDAADLFAKLSDEEMEHSKKLHRIVTAMIDVYRKKNGDPPPEMMAVYEYLHKKQIEQSEKVLMMHKLYDEQ